MSPIYRGILMVLCTAGLMAGCASSPPIELHLAREAVETARNEGAQSYASTELQQATSDLARGELLLDNNQTNEAISALQQASRWAVTAKNKSREQRQSIQHYLAYCDTLKSQQRLQDVKERIHTSVATFPTVAPPPPLPSQEMAHNVITHTEAPIIRATEYRVGSGENLYAIAARPTIYGEGLLWPLIYRANRDQIKDPRQIFPGQILSVPQNITEEEKESARETARRSGIFLP
nr:DUF4398 domain-containing protein [uncultured Desulfuromonas sp.]